jgi:hypothetical protein
LFLVLQVLALLFLTMDDFSLWAGTRLSQRCPSQRHIMRSLPDSTPAVTLRNMAPWLATAGRIRRQSRHGLAQPARL